jgi:ABC-type lipoprotein export system ATPase subunit
VRAGDPAEVFDGGIAPIQLSRSHSFGRARQIHTSSVGIRAGEIVIVTGPSGSGKTTLLTLIGALRSAQEGSVQVLGSELRGASSRVLERVRRDIGYIFQAHNLLDALDATQNVMMSLLIDRAGRREATKGRNARRGGARTFEAPRPRCPAGSQP